MLTAPGCGGDSSGATGARAEPPAPLEPAAPTTPEQIEEAYRAPVERITQASGEAGFAWAWLRHLCGGIGHRISGSERLERAIAWAAEELEGVEGVRVERQPVEVPAWIRGEESLVLLSSGQGSGEGAEEESLPMVGLGMSVGTPEEGIEGELVVVDSLDSLDARGAELAGKIVLIDRPMPAYDPQTFETGYGDTVAIRGRGPARAAAHGALAVLIRSVTRDAESPPHTGATRYEEGGPRIPGAAVTVPVAERLRRLVEEGARPRLRLRMQAHLEEAPRPSHNVIAELRGSELPEEIVVFGGHIDSWDVGQGCHDDGAGVVSAMAALRLLAELELRPRRSLRVVLFTNEENGLGGGRAYAEQRWADGVHVAAIESDIGAARVIALNVDVDELRRTDALGQLGAIARLLEPAGVRLARAGFGGSDIGPLHDRGTPAVGILHDPEHYFDLHHTAADTIERVDREEFLQGVAVMAATAYVLADMGPRLANPR